MMVTSFFSKYVDLYLLHSKYEKYDVFPQMEDKRRVFFKLIKYCHILIVYKNVEFIKN